MRARTGRTGLRRRLGSWAQNVLNVYVLRRTHFVASKLKSKGMEMDRLNDERVCEKSNYREKFDAKLE